MYKGLQPGTEDRKRMRAEMNAIGADEEILPQVRNQIRRDGIDSDDNQRECPLPVAISFQTQLKRRQQQEASAAAEQTQPGDQMRFTMGRSR